MRKILSFIIALLLLSSAFPGFAEETVENTEGVGSKFEQVMLKKGTLIVKEYTDFGSLEAGTWALKFQTASILDVETGTKVYALRLTGQHIKDEDVGIMGSDEIDGAIQTLQYIKQHSGEMKDYSEIVYTTSSGMTIGAYCASYGKKLFVKVTPYATECTYDFTVRNIDSLISLFEEAREKLGN